MLALRSVVSVLVSFDASYLGKRRQRWVAGL